MKWPFIEEDSKESKQYDNAYSLDICSDKSKLLVASHDSNGQNFINILTLNNSRYFNGKETMFIEQKFNNMPFYSVQFSTRNGSSFIVHEINTVTFVESVFYQGETYFYID